MKHVLIWAGLVVWFNLALCAGALGVVGAFPAPFPQVLLFAITVALLLCLWKSSTLRVFAIALPLRGLVLFHVSRLAGIGFLVLRARGELPGAFAIPAGWGDIAVATAALGVACIPPATTSGRLVYLGWNVLGLADILFVIATAGRLAMTQPGSMAALTRLPLSLLPTFLVPLIIVTHVVLLLRLCGSAKCAR